MAAISGFAGRVLVGATNLTATRWQLMWKTDALDVTCFEAQGGPSRGNAALDASAGWINPPATAGQFSNQGEDGLAGVATPLSNWAAGITDMECSVDCYYDTTIAPFNSASPVIVPGLIVAVKLYIDRSAASRAWGTLQVLVDSVSNDDEVRGVCKWSFTGKVAGVTSGTGTLPPLT